MSTKESSFAERITPVLLIVVVGLAFITGSLWQKVNSLNTTGGTGTIAQADPQAPQAPQVAYAELSGEEAQAFPSIDSLSGEHMRGSQNPEVVLFEYSDLECPFCATFHTTAKQVVEEYGDRVAWVYRHFPLDSIHPNARPAALGAECASSLGGPEVFWQFIDEVFASQQTAMQRLPEIAVELGIDRGAYETCVSSGQFSDLVENDYQSGLDLGVTGTPGNYLINRDGEVQVVYGAVPAATLKEAIEEALN